MHEVRSIQDLLDRISRDEILLPEFQRGYVWKPDQVRGLMQSLYRKHPTGHLLIWRTYKPSLVRGGEAARDGHSLLLLDGQQRLTTLYVLFRGKAPKFYEGESLFFNLHFNMQTEEFRFWQKSLMEKSPAWIGVHDFLRKGLNALLERLDRLDESRRTIIQQNLARLSKLDRVRDYTYTVDQVSGEDYSVEEVVDIFNRVNSRGTPLKKADLALAHVCSLWPEARRGTARLRREDGAARLQRRSQFPRALSCGGGDGIGVAGGFLPKDERRHVPGCLAKDAAGVRASGGRPAPGGVHQRSRRSAHQLRADPGHHLPGAAGRAISGRGRAASLRPLDLPGGLWARYSGSTDTKLQQDVALVTGRDLDPTHELESSILRERGRVTLQEGDLDRARIDSAVARLSRIVARHRGARDWFTGVRIYEPLTGESVGGERHYIFSRKVLERAGFSDTTRINAVANRALLGQPAPREHRGASPAEYLPEVEEFQPGALRAQSVPMDRTLWRPERFLDFLAARRRLLAEAMNEFIAGWLPEKEVDPEQHVRALIAAGETDTLEFKSSLRWDRREDCVNKRLEAVVVKTLAGFLNAAGGTLLIGVDDAGATVGLAADYASLKKPNRDGFELHLQQVIGRDLGEAVSASFLTVNFHEIDGQDICQVTVEPSHYPIYVEHQNEALFYLRVGNGTRALPVDEVVKYVQTRWGTTA